MRQIKITRTINELGADIAKGTLIFEGGGKTKSFDWEMIDPGSDFVFNVKTEGKDYLSLSSKSTPTEMKAFSDEKALLLGLGFVPLLTKVTNLSMASYLLSTDKFVPRPETEETEIKDDIFEKFFSN